MKRIYLFLVALVSFVTGCTNSGAFLASHQTIVNMREGNYTLTATNISGEAEAGYILGISYSSGFLANTLAIARVDGTGKLYAEAFENLWTNYETNHGMTSDRKLALTNVRYDADMVNLILYTKVKVTVTADVVEFQSSLCGDYMTCQKNKGIYQ